MQSSFDAKVPQILVIVSTSLPNVNVVTCTCSVVYVTHYTYKTVCLGQAELALNEGTTVVRTQLLIEIGLFAGRQGRPQYLGPSPDHRGCCVFLECTRYGGSFIQWYPNRNHVPALILFFAGAKSQLVVSSKPRLVVSCRVPVFGLPNICVFFGLICLFSHLGSWPVLRRERSLGLYQTQVVR